MKKFFPPLLICLTCGNVFAQSNANSQEIQANFQEYVRALGNNGSSRNIATLTAFTTKEATKGSRYFMNKWMKGKVTGFNGKALDNNSLWFCYDKIAHDLIVTADKQSVMEIENSQIQAFELTDDASVYHFKKVPLLGDSLFFQPLVEDPARYSLYKQIKTGFIRANYHTDGLTESGNRYDEYKDEALFYIIFPDRKTSKQILLKKKSVREAFANNPEAEKFLAQHRHDDVDESFLIALVKYLNN